MHIGDKVNNPMKAQLKVKAGTSYLTLEVAATSIYGNVTGYIYIIDGVETQEKTDSMYKTEGLEAESTHTVKAIAIDEKGNRKQTNTITITTQPRTYLYKSGKEYIEFKIEKQNNSNISIVTEETSTEYTKLCIDVSYLYDNGTNSTEIGYGDIISSSGEIGVGEKTIKTNEIGKYEIDITGFKKATKFFIQDGGLCTINLRFTNIYLEK